MPFRAVSTFWIAHPNNNLINNAAAGSQVNNTEVHQCFFAFLFVSVLVYMYMQHSMWSSNSSTLLSGTACFSLLSEQAVVEMVLLFLLHHLCQLVFMSVQRQMLNGRKEGASMSGLEKEMATHSSTLAWEIPWTEDPGRLQSMGSLRVGYNWATSLSLFTPMHWRRNCSPLQCSCLENPRDGGAWWAAISGVA